MSKRNLFSTSILLLLFLVYSVNAKATHVMGSELTYKLIASNTYEVTVALYRDCNGIAATNTIDVSWSGTCGNGNRTLTRISQYEVSSFCPTYITACNGGTGLYGVEAHIYKSTVTLPPGCSNITFSNRICCRNNALTNLLAPDTERIYVEAVMMNSNNSSPSFVYDPIFFTYTNTGVPMVIPNLATDVDGDSLVYSLVSALDNDGVIVNYDIASGYSGLQPFGVGVASINSANGDLTILNPPIMIGVVAILVEEYRAGVKIGEIRRDWPITFVAGNNTNPVISGLNGGTSFTDSAICVSNYCADIVVTDVDLGQVIQDVTLTDTSGNFIFETIGTNPLTITVCWDSLKPIIAGTYELKIKAKDDKCSMSGISNETYHITIEPQLDASFTFLDSVYCSSGFVDPELNITGNTGGVFTSMPVGLSINPANGSIDLSLSGDNDYAITYTHSGLCPDTNTVALTIGNDIADQMVSATPSFHCISGASSIDIDSSEIDLIYYLRDNANDSIIDGPISGTGSTISFNTGAITNTTSYNIVALAGSGGVLDFDGVDDYVSSTALIPSTGDFSVTFWAKQNSPQTGNVEFFSQGTSGNAFYLGHNSAGIFRIGDTWLNSGVSFPTDGLWHYYAVVKSASNTEFYIDEVLVASLGGAIANPSNTDFRLARQYGVHGEYLNGQIDKFSVWNTALSFFEIQSNKNNCYTDPQSGLIADYNFEDAVGTTLTDNSGNANDATLINMDGTTDWVKEINVCWNCSYQLSTIITVPLYFPNSGTDVITACDSLVWIDGNTYTVNNATATHTLTNLNGCDSTVTLNLNIIHATSGTDIITACDSLVWIDGNTYTSSNNVATHTLTNVSGCDSIVTLNLTINNSNSGTDTQVACDSFTWIDGNTYTMSNTTATHILTNVLGCDSVVTLNLTINNNTGIDTQVACDSLVWIDGNTYTTSNNSATHILTNINGCDSIVTLNLTIIQSNSGIDVITACDSFTWIDGNTYISSNNTAIHTLTNVSGCDSIVTLDLTIDTVDVTVTVTDPSIVSNATGATYQWLDCDSDFVIISGETNQDFTAITNGSYAVEVTQNNCIDTSSCYLISTIDVLENSFGSDLILYPNPTLGQVVVDLGGAYRTVNLTVTNIAGQATLTKEFRETNLLQFKIEGPVGIYFIEIKTKEGRSAKLKILKQ